jgi:hypothetical protein
MVNLRKGMLGAKGQGPMSEVPLVVNDYDSGFSTHPETGNVTRYPDIRVHPDDPRAEGQTTLALRTKKVDGQYSNGVAMAESQMKSIAEAAGPEGTTPLLNKDGEQVGTTYAVTADLMYASGTGNGLVPNTKTLKASDPEYGVEPVDGKSINNRIFESQQAASEAKKAAAAEAEAEAPEPEAAAPAKKAPAKKAAAKKAPAKKAAAKRPSKAAQAAAASVEAPAEAAAEAESDQPSV